MARHDPDDLLVTRGGGSQVVVLMGYMVHVGMTRRGVRVAASWRGYRLALYACMVMIVIVQRC